MTDLIETLADAIIKLINSQPRSPTKAEIVDVLRRGLPSVGFTKMGVDEFNTVYTLTLGTPHQHSVYATGFVLDDDSPGDSYLITQLAEHVVYEDDPGLLPGFPGFLRP